MKNLLLFIALLLAANPAVAQSSPAVVQLNLPPTAAPAPDTVAAIHRLFASRRKRRNIIAGVLVIGAVGAVMAASAGTDQFFSQNYYMKAYVGLAAVGVGIDFLAGIAFMRSEERRAVLAFQEHRLPKYLKRKLKRKYFVTEPAH